jgi:1-acyl-sn-glycerol-3-phosphate acyltransferase
MPTKVTYASRIIRTGLAFVVFGAGAVLVGVFVLPALRRLERGRAGADVRAQHVIHFAFRIFVRCLEILGLVRVSRTGIEHLRRRPCLVIANHPTLIDVVLLVACMPQVDCVVKRAAWRNRVLRGVVTSAGYIPNAQGPALVEACVGRLRAGRSVLLFPEGTRSPRGRLGQFHRGAARIALESGSPLVPAFVTCDPPTLMGGQRWYQVPERTVALALRVAPPLALPQEEWDRTPPGVAARRLTHEVRTLYERQLGHARV